MREGASKADAAYYLPRLFKVFDAAGEISGTSIKALIITAAQTMDLERPRGATATDIARAVGRSVSAVTRLLLRLADPNGPALLTSDPSVVEGRAEAFVLTPKGREFLANLATALAGHDIDLPKTHTLATFTKAKRQSATNTKLRQVSWDEENLSLTIAPAEAILSDDVQAWATESFGKPLTIEKLTSQGAVVRFDSEGDAMYFRLRWC